MPKISIDEFLSRREKSVAGDKCFKGYIDKAAGGSKYDKQARSARFVMSTEAADREGDIIRQSGWKLDNFLKNAPLPVFHNTRSWPVGSWKDVSVIAGRPKRLEGTAQLLPEGGPVPEVDQAAWMLENGGMKAVSVGFIPLELDYLDEEAGWRGGFEILAAELVECSLVPVPAHPDALMKDSGGDWKLARDLLEEILDNWAKDPVSGLIIPRSEYEKAYATLKIAKPEFSEPFMVEDDVKEDDKDGGLEELAAAAKNAHDATTGLFARLKSLFGVKVAEEAVKHVETETLAAIGGPLIPSALAADILKTIGSPAERELERKARREKLEQREAELIEALKAKSRLPDDEA